MYSRKFFTIAFLPVGALINKNERINVVGKNVKQGNPRKTFTQFFLSLFSV